MRRKSLLVIGVAVGLAAVVSYSVLFLAFPSTTADCGLGMGGVHPVENLDTTVGSPDDARQAFNASWNDSDGRTIHNEARENFSTYERVNLSSGFREDIRSRAEGNVFADSETVYYFAANGTTNGYSTIGVTESGIVFVARYGSC